MTEFEVTQYDCCCGVAEGRTLLYDADADAEDEEYGEPRRRRTEAEASAPLVGLGKREARFAPYVSVGAYGSCNGKRTSHHVALQT